MRYAAPSGMSRTSSSTAILSDARVLLTINSLGFRTVTRPTVGWLVFGRITAEATCKAKAFELAVEKVAEPRVSVAARLASSLDNVAMLAPEKSRRGAAGRARDPSGLSVGRPL